MLPSLQAFLTRNETTAETILLILVGAIISPIVIVTFVTLVVHDLDGGLLLFLPVVFSPVITLVTLATLGINRKLSSPRHHGFN